MVIVQHPATVFPDVANVVARLSRFADVSYESDQLIQLATISELSFL